MAVGEIEVGNERLSQLMGHLSRESAQFEALMTSAKAIMSGLGEKFATLPGVARLLEEQHRDLKLLSLGEARDAAGLFDELYMKYTMEREREVHLKHSDRFGIVCNPAMSGAGTPKVDSEDVLFF
jgi:hypothetical protein